VFVLIKRDFLLNAFRTNGKSLQVPMSKMGAGIGASGIGGFGGSGGVILFPPKNQVVANGIHGVDGALAGE